MTLRKWQESGIDVKVELSTQGNTVVNADRNDWPFVAGGPSGCPQGSTLYKPGAAPETDWNFTTDTGLNRFSISRASATVDTLTQVGCVIRFPVTPTHIMLFSVQAQMIQGRTVCNQFLSCNAIRDGGGSIVGFASAQQQSPSSWATMTIVTPMIPDDVHYLDVQLRCGPISPFAATWGGQFSGLYYVDSEGVPPDYAWRDITCDVRSIETRYGRERFTSRYDTGTASILLNNDDGEYRYAEPHPFNLRPGRLVRITATKDGATYPLFFGVLDSLADSYTMKGRAVTTMTVHDPQALYANTPTPTLGTPGLTWQKSGARINLLLDAGGWLQRAVDVGQWSMQPIVANGRPLRDEMGLTADSEGGSVFADRQGQIVYKDRTWLTSDPNLQNVTANLLARPDLSEDDTTLIDPIPELPDAPTICVNQFASAWSLDRLINYVQLANAGGNAQTFENRASQRKYGIFTYQRLDYVQYIPDADANGYLAIRANDLMAGFQEAKVRVDSITYRPMASDDANAWKWTLSVFLNWLVRVWYGNEPHNWGYAIVTHVQSVRHTITTNDWQTQISLDQPIAYTDVPVVVPTSDHWQRGRWEVSRWQYAKFDEARKFDRTVFEGN